MDLTDIQALYAYNRWANERILPPAEKLTPGELTRDLGSSHGSIRDTLAHILSGEWIYLERWKGNSPRALLPPEDFPSVDSLKARGAQVDAEQRRFVASLTQEALQRRVAYINTKGERWEYPLWQIMVHVVNHSTYHRGQVTTMLRQLGVQPVATDFLLYYDLTGSA